MRERGSSTTRTQPRTGEGARGGESELSMCGGKRGGRMAGEGRQDDGGGACDVGREAWNQFYFYLLSVVWAR